jgi:hypothetical protein
VALIARRLLMALIAGRDIDPRLQAVLRRFKPPRRMRSGLKFVDVHMAGLAFGGSFAVIMAFYANRHRGERFCCAFVSQLDSGVTSDAIRFNGRMLVVIKAGEATIDR